MQYCFYTMVSDNKFSFFENGNVDVNLVKHLGADAKLIDNSNRQMTTPKKY